MNEPSPRQGYQSRTWILVAEPGRARLLSQGVDDGGLEEQEVFERIEPPGGMTFPAGDAFAQVLVDHLVDAYEGERFTRLLLISRDLDFLDSLYGMLPPTCRPAWICWWRRISSTWAPRWCRPACREFRRRIRPGDRVRRANPTCPPNR